MFSITQYHLEKREKFVIFRKEYQSDIKANSIKLFNFLLNYPSRRKIFAYFSTKTSFCLVKEAAIGGVL